MENNQSKQILDTTFRHLEEVLDEMRRKKANKQRLAKESGAEIKAKNRKEQQQNL